MLAVDYNKEEVLTLIVREDQDFENMAQFHSTFSDNIKVEVCVGNNPHCKLDIFRKIQNRKLEEIDDFTLRYGIVNKLLQSMNSELYICNSLKRLKFSFDIKLEDEEKYAT